MSTFEAFTDILYEWKELSLAEGTAIQSGSWASVILCQNQKRRLMAAMDHVRKTCMEDVSDLPIVRELIELELRNSEWLEQKRKSSTLEKRRLDNASSNLRRVHSAYGRRYEPVWNSFS